MKKILFLMTLTLSASVFASLCTISLRCVNASVVPFRVSELSQTAIDSIDSVPNAARLIVNYIKDGDRRQGSEIFKIDRFGDDGYFFESSFVKKEIQQNKNDNKTSLRQCADRLNQYASAASFCK